MLRRFGSKWQRTVAIFAIILAVLFSPFSFSSLEAVVNPEHVGIVAATDHHLEWRPVRLHLVKSTAQHRHSHNSADHSHDIPTGITAAGAAERQSRSAWAFALSAANTANRPTSIERPPKMSAFA